MRGRIACSSVVRWPEFSLVVAKRLRRSLRRSQTALQPPTALEQDFFTAIREGNAKKVLSYVPKHGVNLGAEAQPVTRAEVEQQFLAHRGLYCRLFDSSCINAPINLDNSARACSYRELLTHSQKVRTAASAMTRNGVQQAVLVARIQNDRCPNGKLIDFIFNLEADGWKLFSIP